MRDSVPRPREWMTEQHTLKDLVRGLAEERGFDLQGYKFTTLERRVRRRMQQLDLGSYQEYMDYIRRNHGETARLLDSVLINVTRFFRDPQAWEALAQDVLPMLFAKRPPEVRSACGLPAARPEKSLIPSPCFSVSNWDGV